MSGVEDTKRDDVELDKRLDEVLGSDFIRKLLNSSKTGFFLTRKSIAIMGFSIGIPILYSSREYMLRNLFRSALYDKKLLNLIDVIKNYAISIREIYKEISSKYEILSPLIGENLKKVEDFLQELEGIKNKLTQIQDSEVT
ncbi:MAG: hypothetical protein QXV69_09710 [Sulfolobaceae archaeon]